MNRQLPLVLISLSLAACFTPVPEVECLRDADCGDAGVCLNSKCSGAAGGGGGSTLGGGGGSATGGGSGGGVSGGGTGGGGFAGGPGGGAGGGGAIDGGVCGCRDPLASG